MLKYNDVLSSIRTNLAPGTLITADKHRQVEKDLLDFAENQWLYGNLYGDIKKVFCTDDYIDTHFDETGKGIIGGEREGWAICNGNNATKNRAGRVSIGYGTNSTTNTKEFTLLGQTGGSKNAVIVSHTHNLQLRANRQNNWKQGSDIGCTGWGASTRDTDFTGESGENKNMQPYVVVLFIQRVPY